MGRARAALALLSAGLLWACAGAGDPPAPPARALRWGIYQIYWSRDYAEHLRRELKKFASTPDYVMFFRDLGRPYPKAAVDAITAAGATPIVSLELWHWHDRPSPETTRLDDLAGGAYDAFLTRWARAARKDGRKVLLRFGFEMNGDWFSWGGRPELFVRAWKHARAIFESEKAHNVVWVWCPNVMSVPDTPENSMHRYYPGDAFVDVVALDGYNFGCDHDEWHHWQSFGEIFDEVLADFAARYAKKPALIGETACPPGRGEQRARWIRDAYEQIAKWPQVKGVVWFNLDKRREGEPDWRIDTTPESLRAFNETFAKKRPR